MKMTAQEYARRVQKAGPHSPLLADCLWAFCVGGGICLLGEGLRQLFLRQGADKMFLIAGPVIVYGTLAAVVYGVVLWLLGASAL